MEANKENFNPIYDESRLPIRKRKRKQAENQKAKSPQIDQNLEKPKNPPKAKEINVAISPQIHEQSLEIPPNFEYIEIPSIAQIIEIPVIEASFELFPQSPQRLDVNLEKAQSPPNETHYGDYWDWEVNHHVTYTELDSEDLALFPNRPQKIDDG